MLSKENTKEQVTDNLSKLIVMQKEDTLLSSSQQTLNLPEGFTVGKAIGGGDCFFDAVAQGLKQVKSGTNFTVKSLREVCRKQALSNQEIMKEKIIEDARNYEDLTVVPPEPDIDDDELWKTYLIGIVYNAEDIEEMKDKSPCLYKKLTDLKYGNTLKVPVWGRPEIEGKMICSEYKVRLHLIEVITTVDGESVFIHSILDSEGYKKDVLDCEILNQKVYNRKDTAHILNRGRSHFEPVLKKILKEPCEEFASIVENGSLSENERLGKIKAFFRTFPSLDVNFQVNEHNDIPLHIAVYKGEFKTSKFLLKIGASVSILNIDGKTPIDIAEDNNRKDILKILQPLVVYKKTDVPGDGNCLFWSVALAYLTSVKFDYYAFSKRFKKLFGKNYDVKIQRIIQSNTNIYKNSKMRKLVTEEFRNRVINEMYHSQEELQNKISMEDFIEIHNGGYFTEGIFRKRFEDEFSAKRIKKYDINTSKLQPNFFDENAVKEICTELNKVQKYSQIQQFLFKAYLECMETSKSWGGKHEINATSKLLETAIIVSQEGEEDCIYNEEKKYFSKIYLSYEKGQHYQFYQAKYSNLMEFVLNFVQLFEMKFAIYDVLGNMLRQEKRMFPQEMKKNEFVRSIFGLPAYTGRRTMSHMRASLKRGNVIKATKSFINLSDLIETFKRYKLGFRRILVDAGCNIFQSFEMQFEKIGFDQVSKLADDIIDKIIEYYIQKEYEKGLDDVGIAEALVLDKYLQEVPDKIVEYREKDYSLRDLYENIGIAREDRDSFVYYKRNNEDSQYSYRRPLIGERPETIYAKVETTNAEFENYTYTLDLQDFKDIKEKIFPIINKEIQVPNAKIIENLMMKVKSHIEQEINFLRSYIVPYRRNRKQSISIHMKSFKKTGNLSESEKATNSKSRLYRVEENSKILSLMEKNLNKIPNSHYYQKVKEAFVDHTEIISQEYSNPSELQCDDTEKSRDLWSHIRGPKMKALTFLLGKMNFKDVCAPVKEFTGRQEQIEDVYKKLQAGTVVIIGPPGIGKTQLARKYVERNKEVYFHVYEADVESMLSIESSFASFIQDKLAMSMEKEEGHGKKRCLFLFEGAKKKDVEKILKIKGQRGGFDCLFTSSDYGYQDIVEVTLEDFEEEQAKQLVKKILGTASELQDEQVKILVEKLKKFPLAIKQAATCIRNRKLSAPEEAFGIYEYLTQYEDFDQALPQITGQNEYSRVLQVTSLISMKVIQEVDAREELLKVLNVMAYFGPGQIDPGLFLNCRKKENELYSIFELLEQYSLIDIEEEDDYKLYIMHELVKKAIRSQLSVDKERQVLSYAIKLVCEIGEDFYPYVGHFLSLFYHSRRYESLVRESCHLAHTILSALNMLCEYKKALSFGLEALELFITKNEETAMSRYEIACTKVALGEYDSALKVFLSLKQQDGLSNVFPLLSLDKAIISIYFRQKRYEDTFSYLRSDDFMFTELLDVKNRYCLDNYLSIVNTVAKIFIMQERYTDAFTLLYYEGELRDEIFLKKSDFDSCEDPYFYPSEVYGLYSLEAQYTYALTCFFVSQSRKKITVNEEMLPHKESLSRELSIPILFNHLQDILKNQEGSQYLQPAPYYVEKKIRKALQRKVREKTLQRFERVMQLQKDYGLSDNHPKVLSVKFYIAILYSCLGDRERALQKLQQLQELREKVIGINHPDTLITVDAIQKLCPRNEERLTYLKNEMEKRGSLLEFEKSDLNIRGVSILKEMYEKKSSNDYPLANGDVSSSSRKLLPGNKRRSLDIENVQVKRRKIDNQQPVSSDLDSVNVNLSRQKDTIANL